MRCTVIGAGAWGTALADLLARNGHAVRILAREPDVAESINNDHENRRFLPNVHLASALTACAGVDCAFDDPELVLMAAPSHATRAVAESVQPHLPLSAVVVIATKGIEQHSLALMHSVVESVFGNGPPVALSGPSFAAEVARGQPTAVVVASRDAARCALARDAFHAPHFRTYSQDDIVGVELGGALKNVMAIATGIADGLGLGFNARAALITRGLAEITRLGVAMGGTPSTFAGLAGMGDLVLTCTGTLSRNRSVGEEIGRGRTLDEVLASRETVAEGVMTARSACELANRMGVRMPILEAVYGVLFEQRAPREAIGDLMLRDRRPERDA